MKKRKSMMGLWAGWLAVWSGVALGATGIVITDNALLANDLYPYWGTTFTFEDAFEQLDPAFTRIEGTRYALVKGRETSFFVPDYLRESVSQFKPGERMGVTAVIRTGPKGMVITATGVELRSFLLRVDAGPGGQVDPVGEVLVRRGAKQAVQIQADAFNKIERVQLDGMDLMLPEETTNYTWMLTSAQQSHRLNIQFVAQRFDLTVKSDWNVVEPAPGVHSLAGGLILTARVMRTTVEGAQPGIRHLFKGWSGSAAQAVEGPEESIEFTLTQNETLQCDWQAQYLLEATAGKGGALAGATSGWYNAQQTTPAIEAVPDENRRFLRWQGDVPDAQREVNPLRLLMDRSRTIKAIFSEDVVEVSLRAGDHGKVDPSGIHQVLRGQDLEVTVQADEHFFIDELLVDGSALGSLDGAPGEFAYTFKNVQQPHTLEAAFAPVQYELRVESAHGVPIPRAGVHAYEAGEEITAVGSGDPVEYPDKPGVRYVPGGWTGSGSVPASGTGSVATLRINADSVIAWIWQEQFRVNVAEAKGGRVEGPRGWMAAGAKAAWHATPEEGAFFKGWQGDVPAELRAQPRLELPVDQPLSLEAIFDRDVVMVNAEAGAHGYMVPDGAFEVVRGKRQAFTIRADKGYHIARIMRDGEAVGSFSRGSNEYVVVIESISRPVELKAEFEMDWVELIVETPEGLTVSPAAGTHTHPAGTEIELAANQPVVEDGEGGRWTCVGWAGTGSVPIKGKETSMEIELAKDSRVKWLWKREYLLTTEAQGKGEITPASGWYGENAQVTVQAKAVGGATFVGWEGDVDAPDRDKPVVKLAMTRSRNVRAYFERESYTIDVAADENGLVEPAGLIEVEKNGSTLVTVQAGQYHHIKEVLVNGQAVGRFGPGSNTFTYAFKNVRDNQQLRASFEKDVYTLQVESAYGRVTPAVGAHQIEGGQIVRAIAEEKMIEDKAVGTRLILEGWQGSGAAPAAGTGAVARFVMSDNAAIAWQWRREFLLTVQAEGDGTVPKPEEWQPEGAVITLKTEPQARARFVAWSGDVPAEQRNSDSVQLTVDRPLKVKAVFARDAGSFSINVHPEEAEWLVVSAPPAYEGPQKGRGSVSGIPAPAGKYQVKFDDLPYYQTPGAQIQQVETDKRVVFSAVYVPVPALGVSISALEQTINQGEGVSNITFDVWNEGRGILKYAVARNVPWLWLTPKLGSSTGEHDQIRIDFSAADMKPGVYKGLLHVVVRDADVVPREIPVVLNIRARNETAKPVAQSKPEEAGAPAAAPGDLRAYYAFDDSLADASGWNNHALPMGDPVYEPHATFGNAMVFGDRGKFFVEIPHAEQLVLSNAFTIQFWYKAGKYHGRILQKMRPAQRSNYREWEISCREDARMLFKYAAPDARAGYEFVCPVDFSWAPTAWNHFAYVYRPDENMMQAYLNGHAVTNQSPAYNMLPLDSPLSIYLMQDRYKSGTGARFDAEGSLDELAIWARALAEEEISNAYLHGVSAHRP